MVEDREFADNALANILRTFCESVRELKINANTAQEAYQQVLMKTGEQDVLIVATVNAHLDEKQAELVRLLAQSGRRVIGIAVRNPYDLEAFPELRTYLVTYEYTRPALEAAARVLFGERQAQGKLPVSVKRG
jgi:beta-N-acetylhexosaminidase